MDRNPLQGSVVSFARRWHVIQEIDLIRLVQEHRRRLALCGQAEAMADALPDRPDAATMTLFLQALEALVTRGGAGGRRLSGGDAVQRTGRSAHRHAPRPCPPPA